MSYTKAITRVDDRRDQDDSLPCLWCHRPTRRATLANYGARCFPCYEAYCRERQGDSAAASRAAPGNIRRVLDVAFDPAKIDAAKQASAERVAEYGRRLEQRGLS